jgi:hypothetical protein
MSLFQQANYITVKKYSKSLSLWHNITHEYYNLQFNNVQKTFLMYECPTFFIYFLEILSS